MAFVCECLVEVFASMLIKEMGLQFRFLKSFPGLESDKVAPGSDSASLFPFIFARELRNSGVILALKFW